MLDNQPVPVLVGLRYLVRALEARDVRDGIKDPLHDHPVAAGLLQIKQPRRFCH